MKEVDPDWSPAALERRMFEEFQKHRDQKVAFQRREARAERWEKMRAAYAPRQERQIRRAKRLRA